MLFVGILGLIALGFGIRNVLGSQELQLRDVILTGIGLLTAAIGLSQANRLRHWR
jgi:NhaP-type Na+/H+ or K+/H+ antiporter